MRSTGRSHKHDLALVCFGGFDSSSLAYAGLATRGQRVATEKQRVRFSRLLDLERLPVEDLRRHLSPQRYRAVGLLIDRGGGLVNAETWRLLWKGIKALRPHTAGELLALERLNEPPRPVYSGSGEETVAQEKDAVLLAAQIFGIERRTVGEMIVPPDAPAPFLQNLRNVSILEDVMISKDHGTFGAWTRGDQHKVGSVVFTRNVDGKTRSLTVLNVNRTPIEETLGVDLIYYNHHYRSFVMVQYKRMEQVEQEDGRSIAVYRPIDQSYKKELKNMVAFMGGRRAVPPNAPPAFRLSSTPFFFKLCPKVVYDPLSTDAIKGMYLPLDYWQLLLSSPLTEGPRGGRFVTYGNAERYIDNSLFVRLVEDGWIGSGPIETDSLSALVRAGIEGNRSVMIATETRGDE